MSNLPDKPGFLDWLEERFGLPFRLPRIPLVQTGKNLDKAAGIIVAAGSENIVARIDASTTRIKARSEAERDFIEYGAMQLHGAPHEIGYRALQFALGDAIDSQQNREEILRLACDDLSSDPPKKDSTEEIDTDWLNAFKHHAGAKSNSDIQQIWAKILSAEIRAPGTISLRTLEFLSTVGSQEASRVVAVFKYVIDDSFVPHWVYEKDKFPYGELLFLQEIGVISGLYGIGGASTSKPVTRQSNRTNPFAANLAYNDRIAIFETSNENYHLKVPMCRLTPIGCDLFAITQTKEVDYDYFQDFVKQFDKSDLRRISIARITMRAENAWQISDEEEVYNAA